MKMQSNKNLIYKSVLQFEPLFKGNQKKENEFTLDDNDKKKILAQSRLINPIDDVIKKIERELHLAKRNYNEYNNNKLLSQVEEDIISIENILKKNNENLDDSAKISFINLICFILKKINKKVVENEILKTYFLSFDKLVNMFLPLNMNINDIMTRLAGQIKYEKKGKNKILFKDGDKGDKFYIILKGEVGILIPKERTINCCPTEYLKYLMFLHFYQEKSLINKLLLVNRETLKYDERIFYSFMDGLKFYHFFIMYSGTRKSYKNPIDFLHMETKIDTYIRKKNDFSPEQAFISLNLANISEEIYEYYIKIMNNMHSTFLTNLKNNIKTSGVFTSNSPTNLTEFGEYFKEHEHDKRKLKENDFLDKLYHVSELNIKDIMTCTTDEYIKRINCENRIKEISNDIRNKVIKINEKAIDLKYFYYFEVNQLRDKNIFGELALINPNQKRTATIIIKENCHFGILDKESYDISIKTAQEKSRMRNLLYFTNGFLFKGLTNNYFLSNYFFRFKKKVCKPGEIIFRRGEKRIKIYFIISGELELTGKMTLKKITEVITNLKGETGWDDGGVSMRYCKESVDFKKFYEETQNNCRFYVLKKKEIAGLDDMTDNNNIFLFDCTANSLEPTEIYEFDYDIYETCLRERIIQINNDNYVSTKKKLLIDRLYKQRDSIANNEFSKIKIYILNNENLKNSEDNENSEIKNKKLEKYEKNLLSLNNTFYHKKIYSFVEENNLNNYNNNNDSPYLNKKLPVLNTTGNLNFIKESKTNFNLFIERTQYNDSNILNQQNIKSYRKSIEENNLTKNNPILTKIEKDRLRLRETISLLKSDNLKLNQITLYLNKNNFSFPKFKRNSEITIEKKPIPTLCLNSNKRKNLSKLETSNIISNKNKFFFNNQKIFSSLLNKKNFQENKNNMDSPLKTKGKMNNDYESKKENLINEKYIIINNTDKKDMNKIRRNKKFNRFSLDNEELMKKRDFIKKVPDENYKDIFLIDCLCLDKWEEKNNKFKKRNKSKLRGKKITIQ